MGSSCTVRGKGLSNSLPKKNSFFLGKCIKCRAHKMGNFSKFPEPFLSHTLPFSAPSFLFISNSTPQPFPQKPFYFICSQQKLGRYLIRTEPWS
ncbi:hypothetical protein CEXT_134911 [Caerostris extrusa]|uniref:Uncharacterized protein n=1 Tax=Caerostris extrusa TaxID=172846 RepID=A0AAV4Q3P8_CAEEX|nr:hypothetical protein CEXT_134911 [Caerostris extrusa]